MKSLFYILTEDKKIKPANDIEEFTQWCTPEKRRVGNDIVWGQRVSTVFLGIDHSFGDEPPILFETMIFNGPFDQCQWRYETYEEALANHKKIVKKLRLLCGLRFLPRWLVRCVRLGVLK